MLVHKSLAHNVNGNDARRHVLACNYFFRLPLAYILIETFIVHKEDTNICHKNITRFWRDARTLENRLHNDSGRKRPYVG